MRYIAINYFKLNEMKKQIRIMLIIAAILISVNSNGQQKFAFKTTEQYQIELPSTYGKFNHIDECIKWDLELINKKILYTKNAKTKTFNFVRVALNPNSTKNRKIYNFVGEDEELTLIVNDGNYIKIKIYQDKISGTKPSSFKKIRIFTNYSVNDYNKLLSE